MKKTLSVLLILSIILALFAIAPLSAGALTSGDYEYEILEDGTAEITKCTADETTYIEVPASLDGHTVTQIGYMAFKYCRAMQGISIPDTITHIGRNAFISTPWIVNHPNGMIYCGDIAYEYKGYAPETVTFTEGTRIIGEQLFYNTDSKKDAVKKVIIPDSVTTIEDKAFSQCDAIEEVRFGNQVETIGNEAFYHCDSLKSVKLSASVKSIGYMAFDLCKSLSSVDLTNVKTVEWSAFYGCESLKTVTIPKSVTSIGEEAFGYRSLYIRREGESLATRYSLPYDDFKIRGYMGSAAERYADDSGIPFVILDKLSTPKLTKIENTSTGVKPAWSKSAGAAKYRVFRKSDSGSFAKLIDTTALSIVDKTAKSGTKYTYTVRCISKDGKNYISDYDKTGKSILYLAQPKITKFENVANGIKLTLSKSTGAASYKVYLKSGSSWKAVATVKTNTYTYNKAKSGTTYTFTVRAVDKSGKTLSAYNTVGWKQKFVASPALPTLKNTKNGVQVTLRKVAGAEKYRIFRKVGNSKFAKLADTTSLNYVDKTAKNGKTYAYTVRCITKNGKAYTSAYNTKGKAIKCKR